MPHSSTIPSATVTSARLGRRSMIIRTLGVTWHSSRMPITREVEMAVKAQSGVQGPRSVPLIRGCLEIQRIELLGGHRQTVAANLNPIAEFQSAGQIRCSRFGQ